MKRIVIDGRGYSSTTGRYVRKLVEYLEKLEGNSTQREYVILLLPHELEAYTPKHKNFSKKTADFGHYTFAEQIGFLKFLSSLNADLVHFTMPQQPILYQGKHVTTVHDLTQLREYPGNKNKLVFKAKQLVGSYVFKQIGSTSKHIITPSEFTKSDYAAFARLDLAKITVTYEGADIAKQEPVSYSPLLDKDYILYVGQQSDYKNLRRLIQAHQQLLTALPNLQLVLAGKITATAQQNKEWVAQQKYKNIVFTGFVDDAQLAWLYTNCRAYVFPSLMEGFGLPGLEAMSYNAPVISSNATCLTEVYGDAAHYFDPKNVDEMTEKIKDVLTDEKLREKLIKHGQKQLEKYSWKKMAEQTLEIYKSVVK